MEPRSRAAFVNCLSGPKSANVVGSQDASGRTNLAIMSSAFHVGATPPLLGLIIRPDSSPRHTLANILDVGYYTVNHVNIDIVGASHQTSARFARDQCEFAATGLTTQYMADIPAPFVAESHVKIGLKLAVHQELDINKTHLVIGEIQNVVMPDGVLDDDGHLAVDECGSIAVTGLDTYHSLHKLARLRYAKVDKPVGPIG